MKLGVVIRYNRIPTNPIHQIITIPRKIRWFYNDIRLSFGMDEHIYLIGFDKQMNRTIYKDEA